MKSLEVKDSQRNLKSALKEIANYVEKSEPLKNKELVEICRRWGVEFISGETETHLIHELLEAAINLTIAKYFNQACLTSGECQSQTLERLMDLLEKCPTQSWRGNEQICLQQFSTPPTVAFLMTKILSPSKAEMVLEPSAGTGSLAAWLRVAGC